MNEGLDDELAFDKRIYELFKQVDLLLGYLLIEANGTVTGVADSGHRKVLLMARDTALFTDVTEKRLTRFDRRRLQRRHGLLGRSDDCRLIELNRQTANWRGERFRPRLILGAG